MSANCLKVNAISEVFSPKRGRPSARQLLLINEQILIDARLMFLDRGYAETSMDAVAAKAGVSKGTLYARYADKAALFDAVAIKQIEDWQETMPHHRFEPNVQLQDRLYLRGIGYLAALRDPTVIAITRLLMSEGDRFPQLYATFQQVGLTSLIDQVTADIRECQRVVPPATTDPRSVATIFISALQGRYAILSDNNGGNESDEYVRRLVELLIGGRQRW